MPGDQIAPGRTWVTLGSLLLVLGELGVKARAGEQFGAIGAIGAKLKQGHSRLEYLLPVTQWVIRIKKTHDISRERDASS